MQVTREKLNIYFCVNEMINSKAAAAAATTTKAMTSKVCLQTALYPEAHWLLSP